jgi:hypothetical protein
MRVLSAPFLCWDLSRNATRVRRPTTEEIDVTIIELKRLIITYQAALDCGRSEA